MKLVDKTQIWDYGKTLEGRKKGYKVIIHYSNHPLKKEPPYWYFVLGKDDYRYNSLWYGLKYESQEQCVEAAENKVDELTRGRKSEWNPS